MKYSRPTGFRGISILQRFPPAVLCLLLIAFPTEPATAVLPAEPDWKMRFDFWSVRERQRFAEPRLLTEWSVTLKDGASVAGTLSGVSDDAIELTDGIKTSRYDRVSLSREDRTRLFREDFARAQALERVLAEKQAYQRQNNPLLPSGLTTQRRLLTSVQFQEFSRGITGFLLLQEGWLRDVRLDYFGGTEALVTLTPPMETNEPVLCIFPLNTEDAATLEKGSILRFFGRVKSMRSGGQNIRITLQDVSLDAPPASPAPDPSP